MLTTEFKGKELRESKRYKYFGTIELTQIPSGAAVSGHIFNISTGGCLIKATAADDESHPGPELAQRNALSPRTLSKFVKDTQVEARFESSSLSFLARASICRCDNERGLIGLAFLHMPQRGRNDLSMLLSNLEDMAASARLPS